MFIFKVVDQFIITLIPFSMKTTLFYCLVIAFIAGGCVRQKTSEIEGAWRLVYNKTVYGGKLYYTFPNKDTTQGQIKMWTKDHFSFTGIIRWDSTSSDNFGAGTYKLNGIQYEETIIYCSYKPYVKQTLKLTTEFKNDTLVQTTLENKGKFDSLNYLLEKYVRL